MKNHTKILLAEDEISLGTIIKDSLESRDFKVTFCENGENALEEFKKSDFDALVLDVMMPKKDGFTLAKEIRLLNKNIPILFLSAKTQTQDIVEGFKIGCNDYIKKPFSMEELIVRIIALIERKSNLTLEKKYHIGAYVFDTDSQVLSHEKVTYKLTHKEATLLEFLSQNKGEIIDRSTILNTLWKSDDFFSGRSLDVFITKLRKKLILDSSIEIINLRGRGYKLIC